MTNEEFAALKQRIKAKEMESQRDQGVMDNIRANWKKRYGFDTVEEAERKLGELRAAVDEKRSKIEILQKKLRETVPAELL